MSEDVSHLEERTALLRELWAQVKNLDEFTENEKMSIQTEMDMCEDKLHTAREMTSRENDNEKEIAEKRQSVLNRVFSDSTSQNHDLMNIFVVEQVRLTK